MQNRFNELVGALAEQIGIKCDMNPGENIVTLSLEGFSVRICLLEDMRAAVMQAVVGLVPESDREPLYAELLRLNSLFRGSKGAAFALEGDIVTLQSFLILEGATEESFTAQAVCFLDALASAIEGFDAVVERAASGALPAPADEGVLDLLNMIRV